jgi:hypothetical protein
MADEPSWVPAGIDTKKANIARVYDYWLGGTHNFLADQDVARAIAAVAPNAPLVGLANRAFLSRAVRYLAAGGISQFLGWFTSTSIRSRSRTARPFSAATRTPP